MAKIRSIEFLQSELKEIFKYDSDSGKFVWNIVTGKVKVGTPAGTLNKTTGYWKVNYKLRPYYLHRLAWLYVYGEIPNDKFIDHVDGDKSNNRILNLRLCTDSQNKKNVGILSNNTSGYKGVSWHKASMKWRVSAWLNDKQYHIGVYQSKEEAIAAYKKFCVDNHEEFYKDTTS
jgi:hypothetical protein